MCAAKESHGHSRSEQVDSPDRGAATRSIGQDCPRSRVPARPIQEEEKKGTRGFRIFERATRRIMKAQRSAADSYLSRHDKSNTKRRDGWIRDLPINVARAGEKVQRALKLPLLP